MALLRRDPLAGSEAIAAALGTTRQSVNVHLSNLGKKGVILGRGYVLSEQPAVVVIGGANMDVKARSTRDVLRGTSNPGTAVDGARRGRAQHRREPRPARHPHATWSRRSAPTRSATSCSPHLGGRRQRRARRRSATAPTGTYTAVLDADGELLVAIADMAATESIGPAQVEAAADLIAGAGAAGPRRQPRPGTPRRRARRCAAAASARARRRSACPRRAGLPAGTSDRPHPAVTPNRDELAALTGRPATDDARCVGRRRDLHARGVDARSGSAMASAARCSAAPTAPPTSPPCPPRVADVTGAGDAMLAAFCHGAADAARTPVAAAAYGHAAAALTIASAHTVRPDLTDHLVRAQRPTATGRSEPHDPRPLLQLTDEVADALADGAPVVALESTIISHGMPYPRQRRDGARGRGHHPRRTAPCPRRSRCSTAARGSASTPTTSSCSASRAGRRQGQHPRPAVRRRARRPRRDHRRRDDAARGAGRHPRLRHRRPRRRAPRRRSSPSTSAPTSPSSPRTDVAVVSPGVK